MKFKPEQKFIDVNGQKLLTVSIGHGEPIIFIPGWLSIIDKLPFSKMFPDELESFLEKYKVIFLHLSNFYRSDFSTHPYNVDDYANELNQAIAVLGFEKVNLAAHSAGGRFVIEFAANFPDKLKSLILISAAGLKSPTKSKIRNGNVRFTFAKFLANGQQKSLLEETFANVYNTDLTDKLSQIDKPTLILWGENDKTMNVKKAFKFHDLIPNSKMHIFPKTGHMLIRKSKTYKKIFEFLQINEI